MVKLIVGNIMVYGGGIPPPLEYARARCINYIQEISGGILGLDVIPFMLFRLSVMWIVV